MKVDIKDGMITMDLARIFDDISDEEKARLAESVGCVDAVIKTVVDLIIDNGTDGGGWIGHNHGDALEAARLRILESHDKVLFQVARAAIRDRECEMARANAIDKWAYAMYRSWPDSVRPRPDIARWWESVWHAEDAEIREELTRRMQAYAEKETVTGLRCERCGAMNADRDGGTCPPCDRRDAARDAERDAPGVTPDERAGLGVEG